MESREDPLKVIRHTRTSVVTEPKLPFWMYIIFFGWCLLSAWVVVDVIGGSSANFRDNDLALAALMLLVASAIAGSRLFLWLRATKLRRNANAS